MPQQFKHQTHSFIVRFWAETLETPDGELTGQVERVGSGERAHFQGASNLVKILKRWVPRIRSTENRGKEEL